MLSCIAEEVKTHIQQYFSDNKPTDTSQAITWEAHKCVIRGVLIAAAAKRKQERQKQLTELTTQVQKLERADKQAQLLDTYQSLIKTKLYKGLALLEALGIKIKRKYILSQKHFYEHSNKSGKRVARALQSKKTASIIHSLMDQSGRKLTCNPDIAKQFVDYYSKLYNLLSADTATTNSSRKQ